VNLRAHGIDVRLPKGWEGGIRAERAEEVAAAVEMFGAGVASRSGERTRPEKAAARAPRTAPVAHFSTFALPIERDDFGGDVIELMREDDIFVAMLEYGADEVGTPLFADEGLPKRLDPRRFSPGALQRTLADRSGFQHFFTAQDRAFCLYVVVRGDDVHRQVRRVEQLLDGLEIEPS